MKVLNFGSLNIDYTYSVPHIIVGGETMASLALNEYCGGKGLNQSIALARAGLDVWHAGTIGYDGGMLRSVWVYKGLKVDKWFNGNVVLHSSDYVGGVMTEFTIVMNVDDYVEIYQGGRSEQWGDYGYNVGRNIYWGNIGSWTPPAAHTVYYED